jgi:hypothetical protein
MIKILLAFCFVAIPCCLVAAKTTPGITVVYDSKKKAVTIKWQQTVPGIKSFVIQRSADNVNWADIARQETVILTLVKYTSITIISMLQAKIITALNVLPKKGKQHILPA